MDVGRNHTSWSLDKSVRKYSKQPDTQENSQTFLFECSCIHVMDDYHNTAKKFLLPSWSPVEQISLVACVDDDSPSHSVGVTRSKARKNILYALHPQTFYRHYYQPTQWFTHEPWDFRKTGNKKNSGDNNKIKSRDSCIKCTIGRTLRKNRCGKHQNRVR